MWQQMRQSKVITSEYSESKAFNDWLLWQPKLFGVHHVNEGKRSPIEGKRLKQIGMTAGLPDFQIFCANDNWHGLFIEMKQKHKRNHKMPEHQVKFHEKLLARKYYATFAFGCDDAINITTQYLANLI